MKDSIIGCHCGKCSLTLANGKAMMKVKCGCEDCRQALLFGYVNGGRELEPLPELYYMRSDAIEIKGREYMKAFQLRDDDPTVLGMSTRLYCTECYALLAIDHPEYQGNVFLNFPRHCENSCDLAVPLTAYVNMIDYDENIGPMPEDDLPLFVTFRFQQEFDRLFKIPVVDSTFTPPQSPPKGISIAQLIEELGPVTNLKLEKGSLPSKI